MAVAGRRAPPVAGRPGRPGSAEVRLVDSIVEGCLIGSLLGRLMSDDSCGCCPLDAECLQQFGPDIIAVHKFIRIYAHFGCNFGAKTPRFAGIGVSPK